MSGATAEAVAFYLLAGGAGLAALGCVLARSIVRMAVCLLGTLAGVALLYFLMAANFLGAVQLIVYAGGTLIVIVFGVMLTTRAPGWRLRARRGEVIGGLLVAALLFGGLVMALLATSFPGASAQAPAHWTVADFGSALLSHYLVPFELVSVLLLAVMIGAAYLAQPPGRRDELPGEGERT